MGVQVAPACTARARRRWEKTMQARSSKIMLEVSVLRLNMYVVGRMMKTPSGVSREESLFYVWFWFCQPASSQGGRRCRVEGELLADVMLLLSENSQRRKFRYHIPRGDATVTYSIP